jgi:hypothetical protein
MTLRRIMGTACERYVDPSAERVAMVTSNHFSPQMNGTFAHFFASN